jgi:UDP-3-O-[3-hydroxymyristoyl] glucosamine N-acyltransferase
MTQTSYSLQEIAVHIGAELTGPPESRIRAPAPVESAGPDEITFAESPSYAPQVEAGRPGGVVVGPDFPDLPDRTLLRVAEPRLAFLRVLELFAPKRACTGVDPQAVVRASAILGEAVSVGPCAVVGEETRIGPRSRIHAGAILGEGVVVGADCEIEPNAVLLDGVRIGDRCLIHAGAVIGGDGFGFQWLGDHHHKIPQLGTVVIEDDVEIGCNSCVDRATLGETRVGRGTKIDNQVQVAHNVRIGQDVILAGQAGCAGSVTLGNGVIVGGRTAVSDHVTVGDGAQVGGASGVTRDVAPGQVVWGVPARPMQRVLREQAALGRLPEVLKQIKAQERRLAALEQATEQRKRSGANPDVPG